MPQEPGDAAASDRTEWDSPSDSDEPSAADRLPWRARPLYSEFYGLTESPFDLTPNPRYLFLSTRQREALSNLRYALATSRGFALILGEAGTGKTTLVRTALGELGETTSRYVLVSNPALQRDEFYEFLGTAFGLSDAARTSKARFLEELQQDVEARYAAGGLTGLIIDEAQSLSFELLEEIRLLGNIETATTKLLNIVLCGQPELADRLNQNSLRQLKQRIALRCELRPLTLEETAAYISGRLRIAGGKPGEILTREAVVALYEGAAGIPRTVNVLSENTLIGGFAAQQRPILGDTVEEVCRDFDIDKRGSGETVVEADQAAAPAGALIRHEERPNPKMAATSHAERPMFGSVNPPRKKRFSFFS